MTIPAFKLLAAGGGVAFSPDDIAGLQGWWDASDASTFTYVSGTTVDTWADKSGNSRTLTGVATRQPERNSTINGIDAVDFVPSDTMRTSDPGSQQFGTTWTIFIVYETDVTTKQDYLSTGFVSGSAVSSATNVQVYGGTATATGGSVSTATPYVWQSTLNGTSSTARLNGGANVLSATNPGTAGFRGFSLGAYLINSSSNVNGRVGEVLFYDSVLSLSDVNSVGNYLADKWGITWTTAT